MNSEKNKKNSILNHSHPSELQDKKTFPKKVNSNLLEILENVKSPGKSSSLGIEKTLLPQKSPKDNTEKEELSLLEKTQELLPPQNPQFFSPQNTVASVSRKSELPHFPNSFPQISGYTIERKIGEGGMGAVYLSRQLSLNRSVAIKILDKDLANDKNFVQRFFREAQTSALLQNHPHIIKAIDVGESQGHHYFVMEYLEGETIGELLKQGSFSEKESLKIVLAIAKALNYAHQHKMIHRDIKPDNIMLTSTLEVKLLDFGLAKKIEKTDLTQSGVTLGTPYYISPEQISTHRVDIRSDIYSLGATLFHLITGKVPFDGTSPLAIMIKRIKEPVPDPRKFNPKISEFCANLIFKMMASEKEKRFQTPQELIEVLYSNEKNKTETMEQTDKSEHDLQKTAKEQLKASSSSHSSVPKIREKKETGTALTNIPREGRPSSLVFPLKPAQKIKLSRKPLPRQKTFSLLTILSISGSLLLTFYLFINFIFISNKFIPKEISIDTPSIQEKHKTPLEEISKVKTELLSNEQKNKNQAQDFYSQGYEKHRKHDIDGAIADYTEAIRLNPQFIDAYYWRGIAKRSKKDSDGAIADYTEAIRLNPQFIDAYYSRGIARDAKKDLEGAIADYTEAIRLNPQFIDAYYAYYRRGMAKWSKKDSDGAIADYTEAIRLNPQFIDAYYWRGMAKGSKKDSDGAIADYTEAIRLNPQFIDAYYLRGASKFIKQEIEESTIDFQKYLDLTHNLEKSEKDQDCKEEREWIEWIIKQFPYLNLSQEAYTAHQQGIEKAAKEDLDGAIADYNKAIRLNPKFAMAYKDLGDVKCEKKDYDGAIADYTVAIRLNPQYADAYFGRGYANHSKKDYDGAIADYTQTIDFNPQFRLAYKNRGGAKYDKKDLDGAIADYSKALSLDPENAQTYSWRGDAKKAKQDFDGAIADYTEAIRLNPQDADANRNRGDAKKAKQDFDGAIADYTEAIRLNPQDADANYERGYAKYYGKNNLEGAILDYTEAISLKPRFAKAYYNRGIARYGKNDFDGAITDYTEAIHLNPKDAYAYCWRGYAKYGKNDFNGAIADYTEAIRLNLQNEEAYCHRGNAKHSKNDFDGAIVDYSEAIRLNPKYADAYFGRGITIFRYKKITYKQ
jgi:serine/threonine protein kinase/Flp pilus assembly protein TadD